MTDQPATLVKLSDSGQTVADPAEDIRGKKVRDRDGEDLGRIDDLIVDAADFKIRFLRVEHGGILGIGAKMSLIPVDAVTAITDDDVRIDQTRTRVADAPIYDPDLIDQSEIYAATYDYYGYVPFWGPGYLYPPYPRYRV